MTKERVELGSGISYLAHQEIQISSTNTCCVGRRWEEGDPV